MKKLSILLVALIFGISVPAYAAKAVLSDSEMNDIHAGDWVVLTQPDGTQTVEDVYAINNTLDLEDVAQKEIQAVSNANSVDSAVAVSTNVARVTLGETPSSNVGVNQTNEANIANHRPYNTDSFRKVEGFSLQKNEGEAFAAQSSEIFSLDASESEAAAASASYGLSEVLTINENFNLAASLAASSENEGKNEDDESNIAAALTATNVYDLDYNKAETASASCSESESEAVAIAKTKTCAISNNETESLSIGETEEITHEQREVSGVNNHISLEDDSQTLIRAVSNLNSVGSGVAVQGNIASNVGVSGTITQGNTATVVSGL